jgi:hypothetical protein
MVGKHPSPVLNKGEEWLEPNSQGQSKAKPAEGYFVDSPFLDCVPTLHDWGAIGLEALVGA